jgi:hypothetical protein
MTEWGAAGGTAVSNRLGRGQQPEMGAWRRWCGGLQGPLADLVARLDGRYQR